MVAADDVKVVLIDRARDMGWLGYMGKEATYKGRWEVIDWANAQGITG